MGNTLEQEFAAQRKTVTRLQRDVETMLKALEKAVHNDSVRSKNALGRQDAIAARQFAAAYVRGMHDVANLRAFHMHVRRVAMSILQCSVAAQLTRSMAALSAVMERVNRELQIKDFEALTASFTKNTALLMDKVGMTQATLELGSDKAEETLLSTDDVQAKRAIPDVDAFLAQQQDALLVARHARLNKVRPLIPAADMVTEEEEEGDVVV